MNNKGITAALAIISVLLAAAVIMLSFSLADLKSQLGAPSGGEVGIASAMSTAVEVPQADTILAQIDGEKITYQQVYDVFQETAFVYEDAYDLEDQAVLSELLLQELHAMIERAVTERMAAELDAAPTDADIDAEAEVQYQEIYDYYFEDYLSDGLSDEDAKAETEALMAQYGMSLSDIRATVKDDLTAQYVREKVSEDAVNERTTDEALLDEFDLRVEDAKARYLEDMSGFEFDLYFYDTPIYYTPEGYRAVKHILLMFDDTVGAEAAELFAQLESEDITDIQRAEIRAQIDALKEGFAIQIAQIENALSKGESFDSLIEKYGEDPAMLEAPTKDDGYYVSETSDFWDTAFQEGAMALQNPGDVSAPIVSSVGIHIIKYLSDVEPGAAEFDDVVDAMALEVAESVKEEAYLAAFEEWSEKMGVVLYDDILEGDDALADDLGGFTLDID